jgi:hypothetical protein
MPNGGGAGGSRSAEEIEAKNEERVTAPVLVANNGGRELAAACDAGISLTDFRLLICSNYHDQSLLMCLILE